MSVFDGIGSRGDDLVSFWLRGDTYSRMIQGRGIVAEHLPKNAARHGQSIRRF
jgi:hypothetical protein